MNYEALVDQLINLVPFLLYTALLVKLVVSWRRIRKMKDRCREARLTAVLLLITLCTLTFMAANAHALLFYGKTLLSFRVFQMFVLGNCAAYWLVLDLITTDSCDIVEKGTTH